MPRAVAVAKLRRMARPKPQTPPVEALRALLTPDGVLRVHAVPGARQSMIELPDEAAAGAVLRVRIAAIPEDGAANRAIIGLLAAAFDVPAGRITQLRGTTSREKQFRIEVR